MKTNITKTQYFVHSYPSLIGGIFAAGAAIALLVRDGIQNGITLEHALMPVLVGLTVLFGHETWRALKEGKLISCALMAMLAVFGSGIIITETMGRRAENRDAKVAQATKTVEQYAVIAADYQRAAALVAQSEQWTAAECATGRGKKCEGQTFTLNQRKAHAEKLKAQLEKATAPAPVDSKADRVAAVAALFGFKGEQAKAAFQTFDPFTLALFLELGAVAGFGFSVRTRKVSVPAVSTVSEPKGLSFEGPYTDDEIEQIKKVLNGLDKPVTNDQLAALLKISKSEASKRWRRCAEAGVLEAQRAGRYVHLRLVKAA
jgi:heme A synthase